MFNYRYGVTYVYNGPTHSNPLRNQKSDEELQQSFDNFVNELPHSFLGNDTHVERVEAIDGFPLVVIIHTDADDQVTEDVVINCLRKNDLIGKKL